VRLGVALVLVAACGSGKSDAPVKPVAPVKHAPATPPGITTISGFDPASGLHVDDDDTHHTDTPQPFTVAAAHAGKPVDITLRSSPTGAEVAVDGRVVGTTPAYSSVMADGGAHEFTFMLPHHTVARYRFVPVTSGVLHARLEPVIDEPPQQADDDSPESAPVPGAGSDLVNPAPAPVRPDAIAPQPTPSQGLGPQP
jgi:hypothetical protein